jgi:hypothetical protein
MNCSDVPTALDCNIKHGQERIAERLYMRVWWYFLPLIRLIHVSSLRNLGSPQDLRWLDTSFLNYSYKPIRSSSFPCLRPTCQDWRALQALQACICRGLRTRCKASWLLGERNSLHARRTILERSVPFVHSGRAGRGQSRCV